jgi:glycosyltransferase involved in cell wall biosynthesis
MKVLMVNHPGCQQYQGGDLVQLRKTAEVLRSMGVDVSETFDAAPNASGFDIAHVFNLRTVASTPQQLQSLKRTGIPVAMTPFYANMAFVTWATNVILHIFGTRRSEPELRTLLEQLRLRQISIQAPGRAPLTADSRSHPSDPQDRLQVEMLANVDYLLPNSIIELDQLVRTLRVCNLPYSIAPSAVEPRAFLDPDPTPFFRKYGIKDFVLQVSRVEPPKNQLFLALALRELDLPLVLIGRDLDSSYLNLCRTYGPRTLTYIPYLPFEELPSAYAAARVHVLPSWVETCGMVSLEAALANCSVVVSITGCEREYFRDLAYYADPLDPDSIRKAVIAAYENHQKNADRRARLKELILREYSWQRSAEVTMGAYRRLLEAK